MQTHPIGSTDLTLERTGQDAEADALLRHLAAAPPQSPPLLPGDRVGADGRYVVERRIGRGGMGAVYVARDSLLSRDVALKILYDGKGRARYEGTLLREARIAASVEHERVARIYDCGQHDGSPFLAMELVRGVPLRVWMVAAPRSPLETLRVVAQIAEGLAVLHRHGVVHGDLKPENVVVDERGDLKLLDFGLASVRPRLADAEPSAAQRSLSGTPSLHGLRGTPGYMAPELHHGCPADARCDVFALGVIVHELVTGERPFSGDHRADVAGPEMMMRRPLQGDAWHGAPSVLRDFASRALSTDPAQRPRDGVEALATLTGPCDAREQSWQRRARRTLAIACWLAAIGLPDSTRLPLHRATARPPPAGMVLIDVGSLSVGRSPRDLDQECKIMGGRCRRDLMEREIPQLQVELAPFALDILEATNQQVAATLNLYASLMTLVDDDEHHYPRYLRINHGLTDGGALVYDLDPTYSGIELGPDHRFRAVPGRASFPATGLTWYGARMHCRRLSKRLPTENEWEAAARGAENRRFPWGGGLPRCGSVAIPDDSVWFAGGCARGGRTMLVGTAAQDVTPAGVHDLAGNVAEWTSVAYVEGDRAAEALDPANQRAKVVRGGSWAGGEKARSSGRSRFPPEFAGADVGVRCASSMP